MMLIDLILTSIVPCNCKYCNSGKIENTIDLLGHKIMLVSNIAIFLGKKWPFTYHF
jgi:hypothetical protein